MSLPADPAARHAEIAARFQQVADGVADWHVPTPVSEWTAIDVVRHLVEWAPGLLASGCHIEWPTGPAVDDDPAAAFAHQTRVVQGLLESPEDSAKTFSHEHIGTLPLGVVVERFYTPDVFMHTWDLARATGQGDRLDADLVAEMDAGMRAQSAMIRGSGQFGEEQAVRDDADPQDRFIAFLGRDPYWTPRA